MTEATREGTRDILLDIGVHILLAVVMGIVVAIAANYFVSFAQSAIEARHEFTGFSINLGGTAHSMIPIIGMLLAACLIILVRRIFGITKWSGPADSIFAAQQSKERLDVRLGIGSTLAALINASGGASVGQYGPLVHFGATVSEIIVRFSRIELDRDIFIACGVAAAISAGFNAPIAGVLFAHEAILRRFSVGAIAPISVSAIVASAFNQQFFSADLSYAVPEVSAELIGLLPLLLISAIVCSVIAIVYMYAIRKTQSLGANSQFTFNQLLFFSAIVCGVIGTFIPEALGLGLNEINQIINHEFSLSFLFALLIAKIALTALCLGLGFYGGVFGPALFVGAATGGILAFATSMFGVPSDMGYVIIVASLAAVGSAVIGAPLTVVMIVIELTGSYTYGLSALLTVILCSLLTFRFFGLSYFDRQLMDRNVDLRKGREFLALSQTTVSEMKGSDYLSFSPEALPGEIQQAMKNAQCTEAYICDSDDALIGKVTIHSISEIDHLDEAIDKSPMSISADSNLNDAVSIASDFVGESIPVVADGKLVAALTEGDIFTQVLELEGNIRQHEAD